MGRDKFLHGAMILTLAGLVVKIIGSVNRILLSRLLGGEGIGLYQMAYPVYLLLLAISSAGIPVAISIVVSRYLAKDDVGNVRRVFHLSLRLMSLLGLVLALALVLAAGWLVDSGVIKDGRAYYSLVALAPAVFFGTVLASFRGLFQGHQLMTPPAVSQILEQFIRVVTMVVLAYVSAALWLGICRCWCCLWCCARQPDGHGCAGLLLSLLSQAVASRGRAAPLQGGA